MPRTWTICGDSTPKPHFSKNGRAVRLTLENRQSAPRSRAVSWIFLIDDVFRARTKSVLPLETWLGVAAGFSGQMHLI